MTRSEEKRKLAIEALSKAPPDNLLREPLEYIFAEHFRQRVLCGVINEMAVAEALDEEMTQIIPVFLRRDFGLHVLDEEEDLFPLLRRRAEPEDRIGDVLNDLSAEHAADKLDAVELCAVLEGSEDAPKQWPELFARFAANERHHLALENAIVLPLARVRLTADDLLRLGRNMATRRGVEYPGAAQ